MGGGVRVWCSCDLSFPQTSSLSLLAAHGMDFNKWIREGIYCLCWQIDSQAIAAAHISSIGGSL